MARIIILFQSTHPRGVRPSMMNWTRRLIMFQSTHPRGVRHLASGDHDGKHPVSIHAPTRGATALDSTVKSLNMFQSTHPRGVRPMIDSSNYREQFVSIHAPTRGATAYSAKYRILIYKSSHFANINQTITFKVIKSLEFL